MFQSIQSILDDESASFPEPVSLDAVVSVVNAVSFARDLRGTVCHFLSIPAECASF